MLARTVESLRMRLLQLTRLPRNILLPGPSSILHSLHSEPPSPDSTASDAIDSGHQRRILQFTAEIRRFGSNCNEWPEVILPPL